MKTQDLFPTRAAVRNRNERYSVAGLLLIGLDNLPAGRTTDGCVR